MSAVDNIGPEFSNVTGSMRALINLYWPNFFRQKRQGEKDGGPLSRRAFSPNSAAVQLNNVFDDTQTETGAPAFAGPSLVDPVKTLKNVR